MKKNIMTAIKMIFAAAVMGAVFGALALAFALRRRCRK